MFGSVDFTLFGVSWILVGTILVSLFRRYWEAVPEEGIKLGAALFMCVGFFLDKTISGETFVFPTTPTGWLTLALSIFIYFGTIMGLAPGDTAGKVYRGVKYRVLRR
ncbi:MAG: hypothetical protein PVJ86_12180 [Phycisphaerales bacterium]|jgi:hypothetical protein